MGETEEARTPNIAVNASALVAIALICLAGLSSVPFFMSYLGFGHDLSFHLARIEGIAKGLLAGEFPVRIQSSQLMGYGYPNGICYGDIFLYPFAALRLIGVSLSNCYRLLAISVNAMTAIIAYIFFKKISGNKAVSLFGTALWTLSPYRLTDMYLRASVGEYIALAFFPVIAYGAISIFNKTDYRSSKYGFVWVAVGMAGIVYSHIISVLLTTISLLLCAVLGFLFARRDSRMYILRDCILSIVLCALLCAGFLVPFIDYYFHANLAVTDIPAATLSTNAQEHAVELGQVFQIFPSIIGGSTLHDAGVAGEMPESVGLSIVLSSVLAIALVFTSTGRNKNGLKWVIGLLLIGFLLILTSTWMFPWGMGNGQGVFAFIIAKLAAVQYPWRLLGWASFIIIVAVVIALSNQLGQSDAIEESSPAVRGRHLVSVRINSVTSAKADKGTFFVRRSVFTLSIYLIMCLISLLSILEGVDASSSYLSLAPRLDVQSLYAPGKDGAFIDGIGAGGEYLRSNVNRDLLQSTLTDKYEVSGTVTVGDYSQSGSSRTLHIDGGSDGGDVTLPMLWYPYYEIISYNSRSTGVSLMQGDNGIALLQVLPNTDADIDIRFVEPVSWRISEVLSIVSLIVLSIYFGYRSFKIARIN